MATYNGSEWLTEQLESILGQVAVEITVFVSDDSSFDGTQAILEQYTRSRPEVQILPQIERRGGAAANFYRLFRDVDFSGYDYVALADQDDAWLPDKLIRAHQLLVAERISAYSSNVVAFWTPSRRRLIEKAQPQRRWDYLFEAAGPGCTYVLTSEVAARFQTFVRTRWEEVCGVGLHDWLLYAFVRSHGESWKIDERPSMLYRQHGQNQVGVNMGFQAFMRRVRQVADGWAIAQARLIANLVGADRDPSVRQWLYGGRIGLLSLAFHAGECRRRARDRIWFALSCFALAILGERR